MGYYLFAAALLVVSLAGYRWVAQRSRSNLQRYSDDVDLADLSGFIAGPLYFRRPITADAEVVQRVMRDPDTIQAQGYTEPTPASLDNIAKRLDEERFGLLMGVERSTDLAVGWTQFAPSPWGPEGSVSIGLLLDSQHRGHGYGRELLFAAISLARERFRQQHYEGELHVATAIDNDIVRHIMSQLGYEPDLEIYDYEAPNGEVFETVIYQCGPGEPWPVGRNRADF